MPGRKRRHLTNRQRLLFDFFRSHVPGLYPANDTLLGLDHEPIIAAGTLHHRRKNFSLIQLLGDHPKPAISDHFKTGQR